MKKTSSSNEGVLYGGLMLLTGTFSTIIMKLQYTVKSEGLEKCVNAQGQETTFCPFNKPWFGVLEMKVAMSLCLVFLLLRKFISKRKYLETPVFKYRFRGRAMKSNISAMEEEKKSLLRNPSQTPSWKTIFAIMIPSFLDLLQTVLGNTGLLWISSSVYQMARGSVIVFSAILSVKCLGKKLYLYHYFGIVTVCVAVVLVGWAGLPHNETTKSDSSSSYDQIIGLFFIILAQLICAIQIIIEEHAMTTLHVSPMLLVGMEGLWGLVFYVILIPLLMCTSSSADSGFSKIWHEDFFDSLVKIKNSTVLVGLICAYVVAVGTMNVAANNVTKLLSAVIRSILETVRTLGVWLLSLFMFYALNWKASGEAWTTWSWLSTKVELIGFIFMVFGTLVYKKVIKVPISTLYKGEKENSGYKSPFMASVH